MIQLVIIGIGAALLGLFVKPANAPVQNIIPIPEIIKPPPIVIPTPTPITEPIEQTINEKYAELLKPTGVLLEKYQTNQCELAAKDFQKVYGGNLVFIAPYIPDVHVWVTCGYCGHWINRIYYKNKILWVDYTGDEIFENKEGMRQFITRLLQNKFTYTIDAKVFVLGEDEIPYPITYHY